VRILVTGGAGFIGSNFIDHLFETESIQDLHVLVLDSLTYAGKMENLAHHLDKSNFEFIKGDIRDSELTDKLTQNVDAIVNFAAESHVDRSIGSSREFIETNVLGTQVLLESARKNTVGKFLQISTDEVYGSIEVGSWDENEPLLPNSPYAASKASADLIVRSFNRTYGMFTLITRCSNNYGPRQDDEKLIPHFIGKLKKEEKVPLYGDGKNIRDWLFVRDHCDGILRVLLNGKSGEIYNIGGGRELTNTEITKTLLSKFKLTEDYIQPVADRLGHDRRYSVNWNKIKSELGYSPKTNFETGIELTINWYANH
jgi:dTDP-glucose 4,6-dehydratase